MIMLFQLHHLKYITLKNILKHISYSIFFANDLLLSVYFIFISDNGNDVKQKANSSNFLIWVQNGS